VRKDTWGNQWERKMVLTVDESFSTPGRKNIVEEKKERN